MLYKWEHASEADSDIDLVSEISPSEAGIKEKNIEDIIAKRIDCVVRTDQLLVIMQERSWQEEPDILALDQDGRLFIFELKRWRAESENILQVLRYGQKFGKYDYDLLTNYFKKYQKGDNKLDLQQAHKEFFDLETPLDKSKFNFDQKMILITNGLDVETWDSINYWKSKGLDIDSLIYRVVKINSDLYIDFDPFGPFPDRPADNDAGIYVVNTNKTYMTDAYKDMIRNKRAAAYYDRKYMVDKIKGNDTVCLYHVGVGVIAIGKANGDRIETDYLGNAKEEHYIPLDFEASVDIEKTGWEKDAVKAWEINEQLKSSHRFRQTVFRLPSSMKEYITKTLIERTKKA